MNRLTYTILDIATIITDHKLLRNENDDIRYLIYDSRKVNDPKHSLFFALKGNKDGHSFVDVVYNLGVRNFVVADGFVPVKDYIDANFLYVEDTLVALQTLAKYHRKQFNYPVIAITGSNGKTVVKEWLNQLLAIDFNIVRSPKSYNSQIGVALSLWQLSSDNDLAIIEAGISKVGEMDKLREMIQPTVGILTNIGPAHSDGFRSTEEKIVEKLKLFKGADRLIYSPKYISAATLIPEGSQLFTWGFDDTDLKVLRKEQDKGFLTVYAEFKKNEISIEIPFNDEASIENAIICWSVMLSMNYSQEIIRKRMKALLAVEMRLELKNGVNNCSIIDDSYSCDIASLTIALNFLQQQNQHKKRTLILSDIPGVEKDKLSIYETVALLLKSNSIDGFIGIGKDISSFSSLFSKSAIFYNSTEDFIKALPGMNFHDETILLKGARSFYFEKISKLLTLKTHDTSLEINLNALEYNLNYYKRKLDNQTKLMVMVKAFSYGSGSFEIANLLQFNRVDYLAVAYPDEGIALRVSGIKSPIMVMSPDLLSFEAIIDNYLEPEIFSLDLLRSLIGLLEDRGIKEYPIHIKIETGMHRLGFEAQDFNELIEIVSTNNSVKIASVFSHLAASGSPKHDDFTREQIAKLKMFTNELKEILPYSFLVHISNTAAIERWPEARFDMVRLGIGLYGVGSLSEGLLETVATLKTSVSQIKHIKKGETVGYNRNGVLEDGGTIATVKIGYADGFSRRFGNGVGKLLIKGKLVPTVGDICMDMCMVDVTDMPVKVGDEVVVFGKEPTVESLAASIETIPYEIMTGISQRVKRIYFYE
ncbi:bifunctional UDP-N-acetylmuramoyl-tripeptide:D-alanyl-D-alanine ligase/alanine racemase [Albibacterium sp.]|uniref:bifunctional UDP-N-acetylmuramoyl-tripeptide:D-alanyl-D-alanine ligase/alanine racemase n=1 Tax=Albibacterium sp. TaxID=2952885 RepID=UPI002CFB9AC7|nr:bifunctional UDP-N-acetylmuramoyl-tripeptide:D-alanyl-D-alanine ligase/alanine racemase [Albibacterium sp.]HUH18120.1 bifunctional UDP-N-acetylmuramoyl-tripeptide:D-alanyl-D-alanine ligase/alanine racemase [Albibacterium sp.]